MAPVRVQDIADWIIAFHHQHGDTITNLRLQKLLYYMQAWRLALNDEPLFDDEFQAWIHGPVIPGLYGQYKKYGCDPIPAKAAAVRDDLLPTPSLPKDVEDHLCDVMGAYGDLSSWQLERLTHDEAPWIEARGGCPPDAVCKNVIAKDRMRTFYKAILDGTSSKSG